MERRASHIRDFIFSHDITLHFPHLSCSLLSNPTKPKLGLQPYSHNLDFAIIQDHPIFKGMSTRRRHHENYYGARGLNLEIEITTPGLLVFYAYGDHHVGVIDGRDCQHFHPNPPLRLDM
eukprot:TRINITY_DN41041_c2_g1_i1.p1 TRINITY_DN41041_c2_g1~~TRINITY_DN41041_c2_g1_i1.p1  ORF type:complete len:120 (+),score=9.33 TRINITY_DN41041_c2_g1_i1:1284-1643(+)